MQEKLTDFRGLRRVREGDPRAEERVPGQCQLGLGEGAAKRMGQGGCSGASLCAATAGDAQQLEQPQ